MSDDMDSDLWLEGGSHLLVNQTAILRIADLAIFPFNKQNRTLDGFSVSSWIGAISFSPDTKQVAFVGSKSDEIERTKYHYGVMVFNYSADNGYALAIDQNRTRLPGYKQIDQDWFNTYFEWTEDTEGNSILIEQKRSTLLPWMGWFSVSDDTSYQVCPVKEDLLKPFSEFVAKQLDIPVDSFEADDSEAFKKLVFQEDEITFEMSYWLEGKQLSFSIDLLDRKTDRSEQVINLIGKAFNEALAKGEFQSYFTEI